MSNKSLRNKELTQISLQKTCFQAFSIRRSPPIQCQSSNWKRKWVKFHLI
ncbi:hypothetical protein H5410_036867 [Solanum commersonii]|uniref:Uncharacterized protein n=1 Tax=Solanum commersonii TaxID=4109 RepID=A0A9J5Y4P5_SOLCO|nr:hypothetical protein H5410_036867 [Solanum commersonii]